MQGIKKYIREILFISLLLIWAATSYGGLMARTGIGYTCDIANNGGVILNDITVTKVLNSNVRRSSMTLCNKSKRSDNKVVFVSYTTVANSINETGIILFGEDCFTMPSDSIYTGEISAIATTGNPLLTYIEY